MTEKGSICSEEPGRLVSPFTEMNIIQEVAFRGGEVLKILVLIGLRRCERCVCVCVCVCVYIHVMDYYSAIKK